ncbi:MAG: hypothetical protein A2Y73_06085 [Chloroflexi bacterium RBG_13_56_8]|nr:MAG: hypothetical protein A2Y73_06085 [Chloroflexi bacterium RBG_13_56_8]
MDMEGERRSEENEILARLHRVEGQIRGIQRMIQEDRACEDIVTQLMAARAALDRTGLIIVTDHIERCLADPSGQTNRDQLQRVIEFFLKFGGPPTTASTTIQPPDKEQE